MDRALRVQHGTSWVANQGRLEFVVAIAQICVHSGPGPNGEEDE